MLHRVALVGTDVSEERIDSIIMVKTIGELGTMSAVTSNILFLRSVLQLLVTANVVPNSPIIVSLMTEATSSSDTSILT
jgi:hypothetical protein